jgi:hypothetical protein
VALLEKIKLVPPSLGKTTVYRNQNIECKIYHGHTKIEIIIIIIIIIVISIKTT